MKKSILITMALTAGMLASAHAFDVYQQVEALDNPVVDASGAFITPGNFTIRVGTFNFSANFTLNNAAIQANASNLAVLNGNFTDVFSFDGTEGDSASLGVNADFTAPGNFYAYLLTTNTTWQANATWNSTSARPMYAWIQRDSNFSEMGIFAATSLNFAGATDEITDATANLQIQESNNALQVVVGIDRTATANNDFQLVPEPSSALLILGGLAAVGLRRRRA